jgi:hypothetical protein
MSKFQPPVMPFVEAHNKGRKQRPTAIVLRSSFTTSEKGAALGIANNLHKRNAPNESYHYIVDEATTYRGVWDNVTSYYGAEDPRGALSINMCSQPVMDASFWDDGEHVKVLDRTVDLVAQLVLAYKIPVRYLDVEDQLRWSKFKTRRRGGLIVRVAGEWPYDQFLSNVKTQIAFFKASL